MINKEILILETILSAIIVALGLSVWISTEVMNSTLLVLVETTLSKLIRELKFKFAIRLISQEAYHYVCY